MHRASLIGLSLVVLTAACTRSPQPAAESPPTSASTETVTPSEAATSPAAPSPTPLSSAAPLPSGVPAEFDRSVPAAQVPTDALVPAGAQVTGTWFLPGATGIGDQIVVSWAKGTEPFQQEHGLAIWQSFPEAPSWRALYAFLDQASRGVFGIRVQLGDLTGDGHPDVLSFEDMGGSGACGTWRVLANRGGLVAELYRRHTCDTQIVVSDGTLVVTEAVYAPGDAHCCPSATRTTTLRWDGATWEVVKRVTTQNPPA